MHEATTTPTVTDTKPHQRGALDRDTFCPRLQRLLLGAASEHGHRGNLAQVVASIERGGVGGAGEDPNLGMLRRLGATDTRGIDNRIGQLRELEQEWRSLTPDQQRDALVHYLGTPRAHHTLRSFFGEGQGGLAGMVLHLWQGKQARTRARGADTSVQATLDAVRVELSPLEQAIGDALAVATRPLPHPALDGADEETVARTKVALREARRARRNAQHTVDTLRGKAEPLRLKQARLCAELADAAAISAAVDDEQALVDLCRSGRLDGDAKGKMLNAAAARVRALHRAWYAARKRAAKSWADGESAA